MKTATTPRQLPTYFKRIGLAVMVLAVVPLVLKAIGSIDMARQTRHLVGVLTMNAFILGMLLIALAKDKVEDEMFIAIRIQSMAVAFIFAVFYVIVTPFVALAFNDPVDTMTGQQVVLTMLLIYLFTYYMRKRRVR